MIRPHFAGGVSSLTRLFAERQFPNDGVRRVGASKEKSKIISLCR